MKREKEIHPREDQILLEEESWEEEMERDRAKQNLLLIMTSSWGISFLIHFVLIIVLMFIYFVKPLPKKPPVVISRPEKIEQPLDETAPRMLRDTPEIKVPDQDKKPVKILTPEKVTSERPKGSQDAQANKNLNSNKTFDCYGPAGGPCGAYGFRDGVGKYKNPGCGIRSVVCKDFALRWLKRHQSPQGFWKSDRYDDYCKGSRHCKNKHRGSSRDEVREDYRIGRGMRGYDAGVTGLATLAFLGDGNTRKFGRYRVNVRKALEWIKGVQVNDPSSPWHGSIGYLVDGQKVHHPEWIYNHAICTLALCEAYAMTRDYTIKDYAQRAVDFIVKCQNPGLGWRYDEENPERAVRPGRNDTSVTGWMVLALKAAKQSGSPAEDRLRVPEKAFQGALEWFQRVTSSNGKAGYMTPGGESSVLVDEKGPRNFYQSLPTMTAVSVLCRMFAGQSRKHHGIQNGASILMNSIPKWDPENFKTVNIYYWYYGTYAMFQVGGKKWHCGRDYKTQEELKNKKCHCWNHGMQKALILTQRQGVRGDCADGSWDPIGEWGIAGGRVYSTAMAALTLEIYYRYERLKN